MQLLIRKHSYLNHRYPVGSMPWGGGVGGGGGARGQNLEHLQKVVFLCWSFLEVYIFATTYQKAFIVGPKGYPSLPYPTPTIPYPIPTLPYLTPSPSLPPTLSLPLFYPTPTHPISYYYSYPYYYPYLAPITPLPRPFSLRIRTHAHYQDSYSRATLSCDSSY